MKIFDTYSGKLKEFRPGDGKEARIYSCGPTVYDYAHIGNMRTYIFMDILRRVLRYQGYELRHVMNITDVGHLTSDEDEGEDKIEDAARKEERSPYEIAGHYTDVFFRDLRKLNIQTPETVTRATDNIPEMIRLVDGLMKKGFAYETSDGIYFDISRFKNYGRLSKLDFDNQMAGARVSVNEEKRHPSDFALWKKAQPGHLMQWESPWGMGYPGWHIECSAMSMKYLGDTFDIHTGGVDHIPVHHENEIAQTEAYTGKQMARYWMHGEFLLVDNGKMSKSLGNTYTISNLEEKGFGALDYRYFCLNAGYRKKLNFTWDGLKAAGISYARLREGLSEHKNEDRDAGDDILTEAKKEFEDAIGNDLNIPLALAAAWKLVRHPVKSDRIYEAVLSMDRVFGLSLDRSDGKPAAGSIPEEVSELVAERAGAKSAGDFKTADRIRDEIKRMGFEIRDTREGPVVKRTAPD